MFWKADPLSFPPLIKLTGPAPRDTVSALYYQWQESNPLIDGNPVLALYVQAFGGAFCI
jgi:hypothetical protein